MRRRNYDRQGLPAETAERGVPSWSLEGNVSGPPALLELLPGASTARQRFAGPKVHRLEDPDGNRWALQQLPPRS